MILHPKSLPDDVRARLIILLGKKLTNQGELIIRISHHRTQERNKQDALQWLCHLIKQAVFPLKNRKKTKPTFASQQKRLQTKKLHAKKKLLRRATD